MAEKQEKAVWKEVNQEVEVDPRFLQVFRLRRLRFVNTEITGIGTRRFQLIQRRAGNRQAVIEIPENPDSNRVKVAGYRPHPGETLETAIAEIAKAVIQEAEEKGYFVEEA